MSSKLGISLWGIIIAVFLIVVGLASYFQSIKSTQEEGKPTAITATPTSVPSPTTIPTPTPTPTVALYQTQKISPYPTPTVYVYPTPVVYPLPLPIPIPDVFTYLYYDMIYGAFGLINATVAESFNLVNTVIDYQFGVLNNAIDETRFFLRNAFPILTDPQRRQQLLEDRQNARQDRFRQFYNRPRPTLNIQRDRNLNFEREKILRERLRQ